AAAALPPASVVLAAGLVAGGVAVPLVTGAVRRRAGAREATARAALTSELVETLRGAPELAVYGQADDRLEMLSGADRALLRVARRAALADGAANGPGPLVTGATAAGVLGVAVSAHAAGELDRVLLALLAPLALASFEAVHPPRPTAPPPSA